MQNNDVGAAWWHKTADEEGEPYITATLQLPGHNPVSIQLWPNQKKPDGKENQPDFRIRLSQSKSKKSAATPESAQLAPEQTAGK